MGRWHVPYGADVPVGETENEETKELMLNSYLSQGREIKG